MKSDRVGATLLRASLVAHQVKLDELASALGNTPSARDTARLGLFFGPTVVGYRNFVDAIGLDLERALLGGHETRWIRPFEAGESVQAEMKMVDYQEKNGMEIGVFETSFSTPDGQPIQIQRTTFIERAAKAKGAAA
ncbi:MAG TPA: MaoC family dehydratase N-terminal domain-containing protein [Ramlibacter sp.]|uniref:FAS1-like dehydratase domain-containing protein n=1 Tax=Ramlibacter sp. TaxID=1917967 RepID=UPI002D150F95|nr:MaoC family dehydratase N-terminal domain-containing protein [Ramlibacter sp.]HVZ46556.1 MaoC family dehydratase N-terminal domain-containing protein [Ramlibacter sp.]